MTPLYSTYRPSTRKSLRQPVMHRANHLSLHYPLALKKTLQRSTCSTDLSEKDEPHIIPPLHITIISRALCQSTHPLRWAVSRCLLFHSRIVLLCLLFDCTTNRSHDITTSFQFMLLLIAYWTIFFLPGGMTRSESEP
jgi:hypothetical protein